MRQKMKTKQEEEEEEKILIIIIIITIHLLIRKTKDEGRHIFPVMTSWLLSMTTFHFLALNFLALTPASQAPEE